MELSKSVLLMPTLVALGHCLLIPPERSDALPVVLWHGMGETSHSLDSLQTLIRANLPNGTFVMSLQIGKSQAADRTNGFFMDVNKQVESVCQQIGENKALHEGYNAVGLSQGGQFLRALAQRCATPPMRNLITLGAQHQGVNGLPDCPANSSTICDAIRRLLDTGAYTSFVQKRVVQAQYWHDPLRESEYRAKSLFLADINQETVPRNATYKRLLMRLRNFVMVKFNGDRTVQPRASEWFGFYAPGQTKTIETLQQSQLYKKDWLGLRQMDKAGKLHFLSVEGDHLRYTDAWFVKAIIKPFLAK